MTLNDSTCDFCRVEYDDMGNDLKQRIGDKAWCGHCIMATDEMLALPQQERKALAYDKLRNGLGIMEREYWNNLWITNMSEEQLKFRRHLWVLEIIDFTRAVDSKFGVGTE